MSMPSESSDASDGIDNEERSNAKTTTRKQLNDAIYAFRSVVPIVTKQLDKASILNDTITYLQQLKQQVKDMEDDVSILKNAIVENEKDDLAGTSDEQLSSCTNLQRDSLKHKILELNAVNIGQKTYQLHVCCANKKGALLQLTRALEAMNVCVENANVAAIDHAQMLCTLVVKVDTILTSEELKESILKSASVYGIGD